MNAGSYSRKELAGKTELRRQPRQSEFLCLLSFLFLTVSLFAGPVLNAELRVEPKSQPQLAGYGKLPLGFEANRGQADPSIQFLSRGRDFTFLLSSTEAVIALRRQTESEHRGGRFAFPRQSSGTSNKVATQIIQMQFAGANKQVVMAGLKELPGKVNYLLGNNESQWRRGIPLFAKVRYEQLYPGVDVVCYGSEGQLEYDFDLAPWADPNAISLHFEGVEKLEIDSQGDLLLNIGGSQICQQKPAIYQTSQGHRTEICGQYFLKDERTVGFELGLYNPSHELVIDPLLSYATYIGGGKLDGAWALAVDGAGNAYVAGETISTLTNLVTPGAFQTNYQGGFINELTNFVGGDAFVAKLDPSGSSLVYLTYLGGTNDEAALGIAIDAAGDACVTGYTDSRDFPTTPNAIFNQFIGTGDPFFGLLPTAAFVAELDPSGSSLLYSTFLGGDGPGLYAQGFGRSIGVDISVDGTGNLYVVGSTSATNFPVTPNALQSFLNTRTNNFGTTPNDDLFVAKIDPTQFGEQSLIYSTYLGSFGPDRPGGIAVDADGNAYVTGIMDLLGQRSLAGATLFDAFVAKLDPTGSSLVYGELLHGSSNDMAFRVALDATGSAYVTGSTDSGDFPTTPNDLNPGGFFKSTDGAGAWNLSSAGLTRTFIRALAIDPTAPSTIYAGTAGGVFKSEDSGGTWSSSGADTLNYLIPTNGIVVTNGVSFTNQIPLWFINENALGFHLVTSLAIDPTSTATIYAGTLGGGVYRSTNAGALWLPIFATNGLVVNPRANALLIDPLSPTTIFAGTSGGLYKTYNGGGTWVGSGLGLPNATVRALASSPTASLLYAGTAGGVARSTNRGTNWTAVNVGLRNLSVNALALDPMTPTTVYAGTAGGVFRSVNGGTNWTAATNGLTSLTINALALDPSAPNTVYAGTTNGLFKTDDGGSSWTLQANGLNMTNVSALAIDPSAPSTVYAGTGVTNFSTRVNCFISKISSDGASLAYSTVLGGNGDDTGWSVAVDSGGNAYVAGSTTSTNFPVFQPPPEALATNGGGSDALVLELNSSGSGLIYSFLLGGRGDDLATGIALDAAGNAYVAGRTASTNFPTSAGALQTAFGGGPSDAFVTKVIASPMLFISRSGNALSLSWRAPSPEFVLEVNNNGMKPADWTSVQQAIVLKDGMNTVALPASGGHQTFRLRKR